jgi:hypothetical protein
MTVMSPSAKRERRRLGIMKVAENTSANALVFSSTTGQFPYESEDTRNQPEDAEQQAELSTERPCQLNVL